MKKRKLNPEERKIVKIALKDLERKDSHFPAGLCNFSRMLYFENKLFHSDSFILRDIILRNKCGRSYKKSDYYWKPGNKKPRIRFLKKLLKEGTK